MEKRLRALHRRQEILGDAGLNEQKGLALKEGYVDRIAFGIRPHSAIELIKHYL